MRKVIVKVQLPIAGDRAALIYDETREFYVIVGDPERFEEITRAQAGELKAYWYAELDDAEKTFKLVERAQEQDW